MLLIKRHVRLKNTVGYSNITVTNRGSMFAKICGPGKIYYEWMFGNKPSPQEVGFLQGNFGTRRQHTYKNKNYRRKFENSGRISSKPSDESMTLHKFKRNKSKLAVIALVWKQNKLFEFYKSWIFCRYFIIGHR